MERDFGCSLTDLFKEHQKVPRPTLLLTYNDTTGTADLRVRKEEYYRWMSPHRKDRHRRSLGTLPNTTLPDALVDT